MKTKYMYCVGETRESEMPQRNRRRLAHYLRKAVKSRMNLRYQTLGLLLSVFLVLFSLSMVSYVDSLNAKMYLLAMAILAMIYPIMMLIIRLEVLDVVAFLRKMDEDGIASYRNIVELRETHLDLLQKVEENLQTNAIELDLCRIAYERREMLKRQLDELKAERKKLEDYFASERELADKEKEMRKAEKIFAHLDLAQRLEQYGLDSNKVKAGIKAQYDCDWRDYCLVDKPPIILKYRSYYKEFEMVGMFYRDLMDVDLGLFEGYALAEEDNQMDRYAVSIHSLRSGQVGYIRARHKRVWRIIHQLGGRVPAFGYIIKKKNNRHEARVAIFLGQVMCQDPDIDETPPTRP